MPRPADHPDERPISDNAWAVIIVATRRAWPRLSADDRGKVVRHLADLMDLVQPRRRRLRVVRGGGE